MGERERFNLGVKLARQQGSRRTLLVRGAGGLITTLAGARFAGVATAQEATPTVCPETTPRDNTALTRRWHEDAMSGHDLTVLDELIAESSSHNVPTFPNAAGTRAIFAALIESFPDIHVTVQQTIAEGDEVAIRWRATGTDTGGFRDSPPTGRSATWTGIDIFTIACGQIVNVRSQADGYARMRQVGLLPELEALLPATPATLPEESLASPAADCPVASAEDNRDLAARWFADAIQPRSLDRLDEFVASDASLHTTAFPEAQGLEAIRAQYQELFNAFPDLQFSIESGLAEGDLVLEEWTATATHEGGFMGIAPTGQEVRWTGMTIYRMSCEQIVEVWIEADALGLFQQLGVTGTTGEPATATPTS